MIFTRPPDLIHMRRNMLNRIILVLLCALTSCRHAPKGEEGERTLASAWNDYQLSEFSRAAETFDAVAKATPETSADHLQALYGLATVWNLRLPAQDQNKPLAEEIYKKVLALAPKGNEIVPWTRLALARMKHLVPVGQDPDYPAVRAAYEAIIRDFPGHLAAREAFIYLMAVKVSTLEPKELEESAAQLRAFVDRPGDATFIQPAYSLLAVSYNALGRPRERLDAEIKSLETTEVDPSNPFNEFSWQYWNIATIAEFELGDFETARKYYHKLLDEYPRDRRVYGVKVALRRMDELEARLREEAKKGGGS